MLLVGIACTGFAFMAASMPGPVTEIASYFFGSCGGPLIALFVLGGAFRFVNWTVSIEKLIYYWKTLLSCQFLHASVPKIESGLVQTLP